MYIQMQGLKGQGDIYEQREIINRLRMEGHLCIIVEPHGSYRPQDDTAVPLHVPHQIVRLADRIDPNEIPINISDNIILPMMKDVFEMDGLVVVDCECARLWGMLVVDVSKDYYFKNIHADKMKKVHLIHILPSVSTTHHLTRSV